MVGWTGTLCRVIGHVPAPGSRIWNDGWNFATCRRCQSMIITKNNNWRIVPRGYRIAWRPRPDWQPNWDKVMQRVMIENHGRRQEQARARDRASPPETPDVIAMPNAPAAPEPGPTTGAA